MTMLDQAIMARANAIACFEELQHSFLAQKEDLQGKIAKLDAYIWDNSAHSADGVIREFVALRDARALLKEDYEKDDARLKAEMEKRDAWILSKLKEDRVESIRTEYGTAYTQTKTKFSVSDWPSYWRFVADNQRFDLLEKRPAQAALAKLLEENEAGMPPGLNRFTEQSVTIRRA